MKPMMSGGFNYEPAVKEKGRHFEHKMSPLTNLLFSEPLTFSGIKQICLQKACSFGYNFLLFLKID